MGRRISGVSKRLYGVMEGGTVSRPRGHPSGALLDPTSFREFYERALPRIYGYFFRRCGGSDDLARELTQETFTAAVAELTKGVVVEAPQPWIVGIARHKLADHYRRQSRLTMRARAAAADAPLQAQPSTTTEAEVRLAAALEAVSPPQRAALILRYVDDLPVSEVAATLGKSRRATESLLARGRAALARAYGG